MVLSDDLRLGAGGSRGTECMYTYNSFPYGFHMAQHVKNLPAMQETQEMWVRSLGREDPWRRKGQPTVVFLLENSTDRGAWWAPVHGVTKSWARLSDYY